MDFVKEGEETGRGLVQNPRFIKQEEFPPLKPCSHHARSADHRPAKVESFPNQMPGHVNNGCNLRITANDISVNRRQKTNLRRHAEGCSDVICGPRANRQKPPENKQHVGVAPLFLPNQFNSSDFQDNHEQAKFFMIKSYNEDDVHKSIKYSVWSSTQTGNKKLDDAFLDAEDRVKRTGTKCPVFLFFSVNTSGQFVGVAEMTGPVDFNKSMDFWQEERWSGFFPVRWHIVKDVPNPEFHSIVLENNHNRPVYFSRDTQEICPHQGLQMLQIFKNYAANTKILDDFDFYDARERAMRARRNCYYIPSLAQLQQRVEKSYTSMGHLEEDFERMQVSAGPRRTAAFNGRASLHATSRRPQFNGGTSTPYRRWH